MKKVRLIALVMALLLVTVLPTLAHATNSLSPEVYNYDFGEVPIGETRTVVVNVTNISDRQVTCCWWGDYPSDGYPIFISSVKYPTFSGILHPGESVEIEFSFFTNRAFGGEVVFEIAFTAWEDKCQGDIENGACLLYLTGTVIPAPIPPEQQIADILTFFDASVEAGTLRGSGPGASAPNRLKALRNMIVAAGDLIKQGKMAEACQQLLDVYNHTDGLAPPPDFVTGEAAPTLASKIQELRASLNCPK